MPYNLYGKYAKYYDRLSKWQKRESKFIEHVFKKHCKSSGNRMLVFACGTGTHEKYLKKNFRIVGVDKSKEMLAIAKKKNPSVLYKKGDMRTFKAGKDFDVVICLDSMWYNQTYKDLETTLKNFHYHLKRGGLAIFSIYPWKHNFKQYDINIDKYIGKDKHIILLTIDYDPDPNDTKHESLFIFLTKENGKLKIESESHTLAIPWASLNCQKLKPCFLKLDLKHTFMKQIFQEMSTTMTLQYLFV